MDVAKFDLTLTLLEPMLGTVPKDKNVYANYIASKAGKRIEIDGNTEEDIPDDEISTVPVDEEKGWTGFHTDDEGLFVYDYLIKGFIKEAGNTLKTSVGRKSSGEEGLTALKSKIDRYLFVFPRRVRMYKPDGETYMTPSDVLERPLRAMTAQGPRVTLVRSDQVDAGTVLKCQLHLLRHPELTEQVLRDLFDYGVYMGLGQFRNGSYGRFEYTMKKL